MRQFRKYAIKQRDLTDCGAACIASASLYHGLKLPIARIRMQAGTDRSGTSVLGLVRALKELGFEAKGLKGDYPALKGVPLPAIVHVIVKEQIHHYMVLFAYSDEGVVLMDPGEGRLISMKKDAFSAIWTGVLVMLAPSEKFEGGSKRVSNTRRLLHLLRPHRAIIGQAIAGAAVYTILGLSTSIYIGKLTDHVMATGNSTMLRILSILMLIILLFQVFLQVAKSLFVLRTGQKIDARLVTGYYRHLFRLPQDFFDSMRTGELISRINDAVKIRAFINDSAINLVVNILVVIFSFVLMFLFHWKLALIVLLVIPFYAIVYGISNRLNRQQERRIMEHAAELESQLVESIRNQRSIKQLGREQWAAMRTENRFVNLLKTVYRSGINSLFSATSSEFLSKLFTIILLWSGTAFVLAQEITPGRLLSFYALLGYFTGPVSSLISMNKVYQNAMIAADRLFEILDIEGEDFREAGISPALPHPGAIRFLSVNFSYRTRSRVFTELNLTIPQGCICGITGESGTGKSTLAALLQVLYKVDSGMIMLGDYPIGSYRLDALRQQVAVIPQQPDLFSGTILENLVPGIYEPDIERIYRILRELGLDGFIHSLPDGLFTLIGENGINMSGGQRQRMVIVRTLYTDPSVIIFDEATSNLDALSEQYVQGTISRLREEGKTVILIAHRLASLRKADRIHVLAGGRVAESGTHQELIEQAGVYLELWKKQYEVEPKAEHYEDRKFI